jgi:ABC-type Fe3+/spermidine/putrescine transport system ATPase subunit
LSLEVDIVVRGRKVRLKVAAGEELLIVGPSGSGKTTLLGAIAGAVAPSAGLIQFGPNIWFDGRTGTTLPPEQRALAMAFQAPTLFPHLNVARNIQFGVDAAHPLRKQLYAQTLETLDLQPLAKHNIQALSGGEQQRVGLARAVMRALSLQAPLVLLDEPLSGLDADRAKRTWTAARALLQSAGATIVVATHTPELHAARTHDILAESTT